MSNLTRKRNFRTLVDMFSKIKEKMQKQIIKNIIDQKIDFKSTVVNQSCHPLDGKSSEITLTVPLNCKQSLYVVTWMLSNHPSIKILSILLG